MLQYQGQVFISTARERCGKRLMGRGVGGRARGVDEEEEVGRSSLNSTMISILSKKFW